LIQIARKEREKLVLFLYGKNGLKETRPVRITPLDYYQFRIQGSDSRFQRNDYLFYALSMFEYYRIQSTISACGKKVEGKGGRFASLHEELAWICRILAYCAE
jgi:hypothetical protein